MAVTGPWRAPDLSSEERIERLVEQLQSGTNVEASFESLYKHFHSRVVGYLVKRGLSPQVSEELTQEAFLRVFHEIGTLQNRSAFTAWLFKIVENIYNNELRRQNAIKRDGREVPLQEETGPEAEERTAPALVDTAPSAEKEIERRERSASLREAVAELPPQMRRCVFLRVYQNLKYREIADTLAISIDAVKAHLGQAKARLQGLRGSEDER